jgi:hypothetical protein
MDDGGTNVWVTYTFTDYRKETDCCILKVFTTEEAALEFADHLSRRGSVGADIHDAVTDKFIDEDTEYVLNSPDTIYDKCMRGCDVGKDCDMCEYVRDKKLSWGMCYGRICIAKRCLD